MGGLFELFVGSCRASILYFVWMCEHQTSHVLRFCSLFVVADILQFLLIWRWVFILWKLLTGSLKQLNCQLNSYICTSPIVYLPARTSRSSICLTSSLLIEPSLNLFDWQLLGHLECDSIKLFTDHELLGSPCYSWVGFSTILCISISDWCFSRQNLVFL